jgi:hypothetical protein
MLFTRVAPRTKSQGLPISAPLFSKKSMLFTRVAPRTKSQGLLIGGPLFTKKSMLFTHVAPCIKSQGLPIGDPLFSKKSILFTRVAPRTKRQELPIDSPLFSKNVSFYMCRTAYKKPGAPDRRSLIQQKSMLYTHVAPHAKSQGLTIGGSLCSKNLCFLHA